MLSRAENAAPLIDARSRSSLKRSGGVLGSILHDSNKTSSNGDHECIVRFRNNRTTKSDRDEQDITSRAISLSLLFFSSITTVILAFIIGREYLSTGVCVSPQPSRTTRNALCWICSGRETTRHT